jgi:peptidyl-prolyl cis-trans isomerase B (cyclophilin B)
MASKQWNQAPAMTIDPTKTYEVKIETVRGTIVLELYPEYAPKTVNNFVFLTLSFWPTKASMTASPFTG